MRIAFIHDWLLTWRGGEKCLERILTEFPDAEIYTIFSDQRLTNEKLPGRRVVSSFLSFLPFVRLYYRFLLPLYPFAVWHLSRVLRRRHEVCTYDKVVSISHCAVKNIVVPKGVPHLCYCLTPVRYLWDQYDAYFKDRWYEVITRFVRRVFQAWDVKGSAQVTRFVAISNFVSERIRSYYGRDSVVIYPPVDTERFMGLSNNSHKKDPYFVTINALVPYKNTAIIIKACEALGLSLKVIGDGPERAHLETLKGEHTEMLGWVSDQMLESVLSNAKALIYMAVEDFGIAPVEAQAAGKPVIVLSKGGCKETTICDGDERTGVSVEAQTVDALIHAINKFEEQREKGYFSPSVCRNSARRFSMKSYVDRLKQEIISC